MTYLSTFLSYKLDINGLIPIICMNFTLVLLQECNIFTLILLQTFATILIYCQLYIYILHAFTYN